MQETTTLDTSASLGADSLPQEIRDLDLSSSPALAMSIAALEQPAAAPLPEQKCSTEQTSHRPFPLQNDDDPHVTENGRPQETRLRAGAFSVQEFVQQASALATLPADMSMGSTLTNVEDHELGCFSSPQEVISGADLANGKVALKSEDRTEDFGGSVSMDARSNTASGSVAAFASSGSFPMSSYEKQTLGSMYPEMAHTATGAEPNRIRAFAKLEFADGQFYMNTYSIHVGRDVRTAQLAKREAKMLAKKSSSVGDTPQSTAKQAQDGTIGSGRSYTSETGGIVGRDDFNFTRGSVRRKKSKKSKSTSSLSRHPSRRNSLGFEQESKEYHTRDTRTVFTENLKNASGLSNQSPSPKDCPLVPIQPPNGARHNFISRRHVTIAYNAEKQAFEMAVHGRNGAFHDDTWHAPGEVQALHDGSVIQIAGVSIRFRLPETEISNIQNESADSPLDDDGDSDSGSTPSQELASSGESEDDEEDEVNGYGRGRKTNKRWNGDSSPSSESEAGSMSDSAEEAMPSIELSPERLPSKRTYKARKKAEPPPRIPKLRLKMQPKSTAKKVIAKKSKTKLKSRKKEKPGQEKDASENQPPPKPEPEEEANGQTQPAPPVLNIPGLPPGFIPPPRRRGPGRPPKDGIMSKREKALIARQLREAEKARKLGLDPAQLPSPALKSYGDKKKPPKKKDLGSHEGQSDAQNPDEGGPISNLLNGSSSGENAAKSLQPPRSPTPVMNQADYTEEQLQRPSSNYVVLIHEAITNSARQEMNLQQIYHAIERKYPYYRFKVSTTGWQSSVRHNLQQNDAFVKVRREGKGYIWGVNPNATIEKEKRKRASPPPARPYYHGPPYSHSQAPYHMLHSGHGSAGYPAYTPRYGQGVGAMQPVYATPPKSTTYSSPYAPVNPPSAPVPGSALNLSQSHQTNSTLSALSQSHLPSPTSHTESSQQGSNVQQTENISSANRQQAKEETAQLPELPRQTLLEAMGEFRERFLRANEQAARSEPTIDPIIRRFTHPEIQQGPPKEHEKIIIQIIEDMIKDMRSQYQRRNPAQNNTGTGQSESAAAEEPGAAGNDRLLMDVASRTNGGQVNEEISLVAMKSGSKTQLQASLVQESEKSGDNKEGSNHGSPVEPSLMASLASAAARTSAKIVNNATPPRTQSPTTNMPRDAKGPTSQNGSEIAGASSSGAISSAINDQTAASDCEMEDVTTPIGDADELDGSQAVKRSFTEATLNSKEGMPPATGSRSKRIKMEQSNRAD